MQCRVLQYTPQVSRAVACSERRSCRPNLGYSGPIKSEFRLEFFLLEQVGYSNIRV